MDVFPNVFLNERDFIQELTYPELTNSVQLTVYLA